MAYLAGAADALEAIADQSVGDAEPRCEQSSNTSAITTWAAVESKAHRPDVCETVVLHYNQGMANRRRSPERDTSTPLRVLAYLRVSTAEQADSGAGLDAQRATIAHEATRQGWEVEFVVDAGLSGATMARPALTEALERLDAGAADVLVASKLDRVSRSVHDFSGLLDRAHHQGWRLVLLDSGVDTSTAAGEMVANMLARAAQYERRLISQRTRDALTAKRAAGVRLGRPSAVLREVVERIITERASGATLKAIANGLTTDGVPTARGGAAWSIGTVQSVLRGQDAAAVASIPR